MARVLLQNVTKIFDGKVTAVSDFSLDVADGEFMVVVGPSGCGKTTTLRLIAGLEKPTSGEIYIGDTLVNDVPPKDRDIAMVFQNYALYPHMTVYQNLAFALKLRKLPKPEIKKRVKEAAGLLGIERLLNRKPRALSGGQRQRTALGRAIVRNPKAFLFDEPLSNLDANLRVTMRVELKALHQRLQATSIYVTHDQAEAITLGDRIAVMHNGIIQQVAAPMQVYEKPANRFVAGFIGIPPMNFFTGRLEFKGDTSYFVISSDTIILPQRLKTVLANYRNREMVLGIRSENLSPNQFPGQADNTISATVNVIEPLGTATDVHLTTDAATKFVAKVDPNIGLEVNGAVKMHIDLDKIHIFQPGETGKNVTLFE
jgi:multiple sugar transport system ATP-binding protein